MRDATSATRLQVDRNEGMSEGYTSMEKSHDDNLVRNEDEIGSVCRSTTRKKIYECYRKKSGNVFRPPSFKKVLQV